MADTRCPLTELPALMCSHCRGHDTPPATDDRPDSLRPWFTASYPGRCSGCDNPIEAGDRIRADGQGGYLCDDCGEDDSDG